MFTKEVIWAMVIIAVVFFILGILFDRWMNAEPKKYREAHKRFVSAGHDAIVPPGPADEAARMRGKDQLR